MERTERLKELLEFIKQKENNPQNFAALYMRLEEEFAIEFERDSNYRTNLYLNNLRQTRDKEAHIYVAISSRRPKKGAPDEFRYFVTAFRHDVMSAISLGR